MVNLTRELGLQYAKQGIQVNALCPGFYQTNLSRGAIDDPQVRATITAFIPMGRIAEAAEIKGPALFLASTASDSMTGQTLVTQWRLPGQVISYLIRAGQPRCWNTRESRSPPSTRNNRQITPDGRRRDEQLITESVDVFA